MVRIFSFVIVACCLLLAAESYGEMLDYRDGPAAGADLIYGRDRPPWEPRDGREARYSYQYYPSAEVYYEPSREVFFYALDGRWVKSPTLPGYLRDRLGEFVILDMDADDPRRFHPDVARYYSSRGRIEDRRAPMEREMVRRAPIPKEESGPAHAGPYTRDMHQYHYYPDSNVYFDPGRRVYFFRSDNKWVRSDRLPPSLEGRLEDYVIVEVNSDKPFEFQSELRGMMARGEGDYGETPEGPAPWRPSGRDPVYLYHFYPSAFVYHDVNRGLYYYQSASEWIESRTLPDYISQHMGSPVTLEMNTPQPYVYHSEVMKRYPHPGKYVNVSKPTYRIWKWEEY